MARKIKVSLAQLVIVTDDGHVLIDGSTRPQGWNLSRTQLSFMLPNNGVLNFNPWQEVNVGLMGDCQAFDTLGGVHKLERYVAVRDSTNKKTGELRPVNRKDLKGEAS